MDNVQMLMSLLTMEDTGGGCDGRTIFSGINNTGLKEKELSF